MRLPYCLISYCLVAGTTALVDLPEVSQVVTSALKSLSIDTAYHAPTLAPVPANTSNDAAPAASNNSGNITTHAAVADPAYWLADIAHQGIAAFNGNPSGYVVFRNVKDYGAAGEFGKAVLMATED